MRNLLASCVTAVLIMVCAGFAYAEGAPVALTHSLTGYSKGPATVTLEYAVQVVNQQDAALGPLSLTLMPQPPYVMEKTNFTVNPLGPGEKADLQVKVVSPLLLDQKFFAKLPLLWGGSYSDADGNVVEFPIKSRAGGDK